MTVKIPINLAALVLFVVVAPTISWAAITPIGAKAVYVEGTVNVFSVKDNKSHSIVIGSQFFEGDKLTTTENGIVELEFDTGDLIRLDNDSQMVIRSLHRDEQGSTFSIFNLIIGRVKSAVGKLASKNSKFEYNTKTAIVGVAGTPPWVLSFRANATEIDLLGEKGDKGSVFVQGLDPKKTLVTLLAGTRTVVRFGVPPLKPFQILPGRRQMLKRTIRFQIKPKQKKTSIDKVKKKAPSSVGQQLVTSTISQSISTPKQPKPEEAKSVDFTNTQSTSGPGTVSQYQETGGVSPPRPVKVKIRINLK